MTAGGQRPPAVSLRAIEKSFGAIRANRGVSLDIAAGSIHGIVGENGAGKSTLMNILYGFHAPDRGAILVKGKPCAIRAPADAIAAGIGMVHQHFMLIENFSVLENIALGAEGGFRLGPALARARKKLEELAANFDLGLPLDARIGDLPLGLQQRAEILKALYRGCDILILDEPTGVLTPGEADRLFEILKALRQKGAAILFITHKLREIMAIADRVSVMRQGEIVAEREIAATDAAELAELMVGRKLRGPDLLEKKGPGEIRLRAVGLSLKSKAEGSALADIHLDLRAGEILGIAGVSGNGQSELLETLSGLRPPDQGFFQIGDWRIDRENPADPARLRRAGLAHVPEDRQASGLVKTFAAGESAILGYQRDPELGWRHLLSPLRVRKRCRDLMAAFDLRPADPDLKSANFSGGNQQKLILAREMARRPQILLIGQPTRGVDIGAIERIHREILAQRAAGAAILLVSVELDEILALADRILVMAGGRIAGEIAAADADEKTLGLMMANAWREAA